MALKSDSGKFTLRPPGTASEWERVRRLLTDYRNEFDDDTCFSSFEAEMARIEKIYVSDEAQKLIALDNDTNDIAGCVAYRTLAPGVAEIKRLYVVPIYRKMALGRQLAEAIIALAIQAGYHTMVLDTMLRMNAARQLYTSMGFTEIPPYQNQDTSKIVCFQKKISG